MTAATNDRWPSLLQERSAYINNVKVVAVATQIQIVARGLDDLTGLYEKAAGLPADGATALAAAAEQRDELIRRLEQKGRAFLRLARKTPDHAQADQLLSLSVIFGGEAERLLLDEAA
ncbi:MAG TPA: hypothetical protein VJ747_03045 [Stellaceae bacterium]|nr:hypothetical protein [Stellaceae bacterium]